MSVNKLNETESGWGVWGVRDEGDVEGEVYVKQDYSTIDWGEMCDGVKERLCHCSCCHRSSCCCSSCSSCCCFFPPLRPLPSRLPLRDIVVDRFSWWFFFSNEKNKFNVHQKNCSSNIIFILYGGKIPGRYMIFLYSQPKIFSLHFNLWMVKEKII